MADRDPRSSTSYDGKTLFMWTIYDHPKDYPEHFVARLFAVRRHIVEATNVIQLAPTLEAIRARIPQGLYRLERNQNDNPVIVETWF